MISGTDVGVDLFAGGTIDNQAGGTISGGTYGVQAYSGVNMYAAVLRNAGLITDAPAPAHAAVEMGDGVTLNNLNTGTISGEAGILVGGAGDTIVNAGTIIATDRRDAIVLLPAAEDTQITLTTGSTLTGDIFGGGTDSQIFLTGDDSMGNAISGFGDGALTVQSGASWTASGFWTIANVTNDGRFQAGFPGSPLNLTGNFVQASNGTLQVVVTPEATSQFIIDGAAQLAGKLSYEFAPGSYSPHTYDFLTATGGITGAFSKVSSNAPKGVTASTYGVTDTAALVLTGNSVPAGSGGGKTPAPPPGSRPLVIVKPLDDSIYADANQTAAEAAQEISGDLLDRATTPGPAGGGGNCAAAAAAQAVTTPGTGSGGQIANALAAAFCQAGGWLEVSGGAGDVSANGGAAAYETDTGGMLAGIDKQVNEGGTRLGFVVGYDETWLHDGAGGTASIDTTRAGLYGTQPLGFFTLAGDFMAGFARNTGTRATGIGTAHAAYDSTVYAGALQLGTSGTLDGAIIAPAIGIRAASVAADGFSESGGGEVPEFAVTGHDSSYASLQPYVKLGIAKVYQTASGITIVPNVSVAYVNDIGNTGIGVGVSSRDGTRFSSGFDDLDDDMADISAGISASRGNWSVYARYRGYITRNWNEEIGEAGVAVRF